MTRGAAGDADVSADPPLPQRADGLCFDRNEAVEQLSRLPALRQLIRDAGPYAVAPDPQVEPYAYLLRSIVYQQLHGIAAATIHRRLLELFEGTVPEPHRLLETDAPTLRRAGVSANKAASMHDLARHALAGELPTAEELSELSDLELVRRLTRVRGIGPWTVHMLLLFRLGRPDVLPSGDFGVREGWRLVAGLEQQPSPAQLREVAEAWRPWRSVASWYMWRAVDLAREGRLQSPLSRAPDEPGG